MAQTGAAFGAALFAVYPVSTADVSVGAYDVEDKDAAASASLVARAV